ncbi:MAG: hypothetical protein MJ054_01215, partial [Clostridia bacterium]|nr:hypothetical protein [Clostridia bacterium]
LLFTALYNSDQFDSIDSNSITAYLPSTSQFNNPFFDPKKPYESPERNSIQFLENVTTENDLADAMEFTSTRVAFLALFGAESNTAEYIGWAEENSYKILVKDVEGKEMEVERYFRLNHYIYWAQKKIDKEEKIEGGEFNAEDFRWCLTQSVRVDIFYEGVTQESRTTDLVEYRLNWYNSGDPFITFRDYCEWINIFAYSTEYQVARGDLGKEEGDGTDESDETLTSTDGWLTIEAFAVWKRMEKYENNVEYLARIGSTAGQNVITAPILKRKISTTVFPKIFSSGEKHLDKDTGISSDEYTLINPNPSDINYSDEYYGWKDFDNRYPTQYRSVIDRYEYNERYNIRKVNRIAAYNKNEVSPISDYDYANQLINDSKLAKDCDSNCGGQSDKSQCTDKTHSAYQMKLWNERYGIIESEVDKTWTETVSGRGFWFWTWWDTKEENHSGYDYTGISLKLDETSKDEHQYAQLYVPYAYFEKACKMIKSVYSASNGYAGYHNYMKYWARNGDYYWICDYSEYPGKPDGTEQVKYTYLVTNFWNNYNGEKSPLGTDNVNGIGNAYGWKKEGESK